MQTFRVFISSPGDTVVERRRAENVVARLNGEFAGVARLAAVRWETEYYQAHATFQTQIPAADSCDIVVGILRWRIGTQLPPAFPDRLPDGGAYPSGTTYEILTAIEKRHRGGELPDVFVFRYAGGAPAPQLGDKDYDETVTQWEALRGFISRWFLTEDGQFAAAFNSYGSQDDFEEQLETLLRKWLSDKAAGGRIVPWPETKGSPFRELEAFGAKHAPVFFGRSADIRKATDLWRDEMVARRFLLVIGASGAGKSSLARAGLVPRLTTPGVVPEVDQWRVAAMRPSDSPGGPFAALALALLQTEADLPDEEKGRGPALPEIAEGDTETPAELAAVLAHADAGAAKVVVKALQRVGERVRAAEQYARSVRCDLVLLVDQLDELLAPSVPAELRETFAALMTALVDSGRVWILTTLRADLYAPMLEVPALKALKERGASYDLAPPGAAELAEIVRAPAAAAALTFESDPASGERLDERLLREADRPDMLPLVQLALSRLWAARVKRDGAVVLPLAAFEQLGGLRGIIDAEGEKAVGAPLGEPERAALPALIRRLAELPHGPGATLTARAVPLADAAHDAASRQLVEALIAARLLTLSGEAAPSLRLAHQRVLSDWARAETIVAESADFYRVRDEVDAQRRRWEAGKRRGELLLARGLPLAEARDIAARYGTELSDETQTYIAASRRRAGRAQAVGWAVAAVFALVAVGAGIEAKIASDRQVEATRQKKIAERNFAAANDAVEGLIVDFAEGLKNVVGIRVETIRRILDKTQTTVDRLLAETPNDPRLLRSKWAMLNDFSMTYAAKGNLADARRYADEALTLARRLAARHPGDPKADRDLYMSLDTIGTAKLQGGDQAGALAAYEEMLGIMQRLALTNDPAARQSVSVALERIGDVRRQSGDQAKALKAYGESLEIRRDLVAKTPRGITAQRNLSVGLDRIGTAKLQAGDQAGALEAFKESLAIRKLAARDTADARAQRDLANGLEKIGTLNQQAGDSAGALRAYEQALGIRRRLATLDRGNAPVLNEVSFSLANIGNVKLKAGDSASAYRAYVEALEIARKLAKNDPGNAQSQRWLASALDKTGDVKLKEGNRAGALEDYQESLDIRRRLGSQDGGNAQVRRDLSVSFSNIGNVKLATGDPAGALAAYENGLAMRRKLVAQDASNAKAARDVATALEHVGDAKRQLGDQDGALQAYQEKLAIDRRLAQDLTNAQAQRDLRIVLTRIGQTKLMKADREGALASFREALPLAEKLADLDTTNVQAGRDLAWVRRRIEELTKPASVREPVKQEPVHPEPAKQDPVKQEPVRQEPAK